MKEVYEIRKYISVNHGENIQIDLGKPLLVLRNSNDSATIKKVFSKNEIHEKVGNDEIPCSNILKTLRGEMLVCDIIDNKEFVTLVNKIDSVCITTTYTMVTDISLHKLSKLLTASDFVEYVKERIL